MIASIRIPRRVPAAAQEVVPRRSTRAWSASIRSRKVAGAVEQAQLAPGAGLLVEAVFDFTQLAVDRVGVVDADPRQRRPCREVVAAHHQPARALRHPHHAEGEGGRLRSLIHPAAERISTPGRAPPIPPVRPLALSDRRRRAA
jgi:hypothetical protein